MARTHAQFTEEVEDRNRNNPGFAIKIHGMSRYENLDEPMVFECCNGHGTFETRPRYIIQKGSGCPQCKNSKIGKANAYTITDVTSKLKEVGHGIRLQPGQEYTNSTKKMSFFCSKGHGFTSTVKSILSGSDCPECCNVSRHTKLAANPTKNALQTEVDLFIKRHGLNINVIVVPLTSPYEKYHYRNVKQTLEQERTTIVLFEDELIDNRTLIFRKLKHYAQKSDLGEKIHARQCEIKRCSATEKRALLNENHVQGDDNAPLCYGAYYNGTLVAVMTFSKPRVAVGHKRGNYDGMWELSRFCTDVRYRIPGIASKLLKHFQRNNEWKEIYSYADKRWSVGNMYHALGFTLTADNPPGYFYVVDGKRKHRWNYRKDILKNTLPNYDASLTEYQNMENHGFWRVWDCGTLKFTLLANS